MSGDVYVEVGRTKVFACSLVWPGWCRAAKTEEGALLALADYAVRYAAVPTTAGVRFPASAAKDLRVRDRLAGSATTDFGAPAAIPDDDRALVNNKEGNRLASLLVATWAVYDGVVASTPPRLRKGPRGGGRDRDAMAAHVLEAEVAYARKIGVRHKAPPITDTVAVAAHRDAIAAVFRDPAVFAEPEKGWPLRYAARRIAWHVLDHAWEMEDRRD